MPQRSVVVTGATTGIGRAAALRLHAAGWQVFAGYRSEEDGERLQADGLRPLRIDVTDEASIASAAEQAGAELAGSGLDGLVNNAGIAVGGPLEFMPLLRLRMQLEINTVGQVAVTQAFLPALRRARGRIVNVSSIGGRMAFPGFGPYHASKFALEGLSDCLRRELEPHGVRVSVIEPGAVQSEIWDKGVAAGEQLRDALPEQARELYGRQFDQWLGAAAALGRRAIPADAVARAVEHALTAQRPKARYLVGADARVQAAAARLVPDRLLDRLIALGMRRV